MLKKRAWKEFLCGKSIERCATVVAQRNRYNLRAFSILGIVMMSFAVLFGWIMRDIFTFSTEFLILLGYFVLMYVITRLTEARTKHITAVFYLWVIPVMFMGIYMGTFGDITEPSITIMVFLCALPMFILDKPWRIVCFIVLHALLYTLCCYTSKTFELFAADMIDLVLFAVLGIGVNCLILRDRIGNVEYAMDMMLMAETDALTGLHNRGAGEERVRELMKKDVRGMFLLIDFDNFKNINDSYGHTSGDHALKAMADCLRECFRDHDVVMRFGGDEFAVFAEGLKSPADGKKCIDRMMEKVHSLSVSDMPEYPFSVSVGASFFDAEHPKNFETLYYESDKALYITKQNGKNAYAFFQKDLQNIDIAQAGSV